MSYRTEALVAVLVSAEAVLRDAGWPACRGQPTAVVRIGVLAQIAGAVASAVDGAPEAPSAPPAITREGVVAWATATPPSYWCRDPECWVMVRTPRTYCARHSRGVSVDVWQRARLRAGVFAIPEDDAR